MLSIHLSNFDFRLTDSEVPSTEGEPIPIKVLVLIDPETKIQVTAAFTEQAVTSLLALLAPEKPPGIVVADTTDLPDAA